MNKNLYRIVFNKARDMLMVVADIARASRARRELSTGVRPVYAQRVGKISAISFSLWLALGAIHSVRADLVADALAPGNQQPSIISSANGTPQINIQTPSQAGVSRNLYSQFDVNQQGAILNNSHHDVRTDLGGMITGNPLLARGEANVILNEVNSRDPSRLNGFVEVAGRRADVVIANPSGITCNGCGFINASRATLTTGQAQMSNGSLTGFNVARGEVIVEGGGLDSSRQDYTDIIARSVKINADVWANSLNVTTGRNRVDAVLMHVEKQSDDPVTRPLMALDVASLGGMYAGKIRLIGTESGVGVRNAGNIGAQAGAVTLNVDGRIENSGSILASADIKLTDTGGLNNSGTVFAHHNALVTTTAEIQNSGTIAARRDTHLQARSLASTSILAAGAGDDGALGDTGNLILNTSGKLAAQGQNLASGNLQVQGRQVDVSGSYTQARNILLDAHAGDIITRNGQIIAQQHLTAHTTQALDNDSGRLEADTLTLTAFDLSSQQGLIEQSGRSALRLEHQGVLNNREGKIITNGSDLTLAADALNNQFGRIEHAGNGTLAVTTPRFHGDNGTLISGGTLQLHGGDYLLNGGDTSAQSILLHSNTLSNRLATLVQTGLGEMRLHTRGELDNTEGWLATNGSIDIHAATLNNQGGQLVALQALSLHGKTLNNNDGGLIQSGGTLGITVDELSNQNSGDEGGLDSLRTMTINAGRVDNMRGLMLGWESLQLTTEHFNNAAGMLAAQEDLIVTTQAALNNRAGLLQGGHVQLNTSGQQFDNQHGTLKSLGNLMFDSGDVDNRAGTLGAKGDITLQSARLDNREHGRVAGEGNTVLRIASLINQGGQIQNLGSLLLDSGQGTLDNTGGLIRSGASTTLIAQHLNNQHTQNEQLGIEGQQVNVNSSSVANQYGALLAAEQLTIASTGVLDNSNGQLSAGENVLLRGHGLSLANTHGVVKAGKTLAVDGEQIDGKGQLLSSGDINLLSQQSINNQGEMIAGGNFTFTTLGNVTNSARLLAVGKLALQANNLLNSVVGEISAGQDEVTVRNTLTNYGLIDGRQTVLKASTLNNTGSGRIYGDSVGLETGTFNNQSEGGTMAILAGRERVDIATQMLNNDHALIYSAGEMVISGFLDANARASDKAGVINNHSATIESAGRMQLFSGKINNINAHFSTELATVSQGKVTEYQHAGAPVRWKESDSGVFVDRNSTDRLLNLNTPGRTGSNNDNFFEFDFTQTVQETRIKETDPAKLIAGGDMTLQVGHLLNDKSQITAGGMLVINALSVDNTSVEGQHITTHSGTVTRYYRIRQKGKDKQGRATGAWTPPDIIQNIALNPDQIMDHVHTASTPVAIPPLTQQRAEVLIPHPGSIDAIVTSSALPSIMLPTVQYPGQQSDFENRISVPEDESASAGRSSILDTLLPDNILFKTNPPPVGHYRIETDPRFTSMKEWLRSNDMQKTLTTNSDNILQRPGDGYYDRQRIREQEGRLTNLRYLTGYRSDEEQFKALMNAGIAFAKLYNLKPGVALSAQQMGLLTRSIFWLGNAQVMQPDGSCQTVLLAQRYARVKPGDLDGSGELMVGRDVKLELDGGQERQLNRAPTASHKTVAWDNDNCLQ